MRRSNDEQQRFLEHQRFGENRPSLLSTAVPRNLPARLGLAALLLGLLLLARPALFHIGRDDGGPLFVQGAFVLGCLGTVLCAGALIRYLFRKHKDRQ